MLSNLPQTFSNKTISSRAEVLGGLRLTDLLAGARSDEKRIRGEEADVTAERHIGSTV